MARFFRPGFFDEQRKRRGLTVQKILLTDTAGFAGPEVGQRVTASWPPLQPFNHKASRDLLWAGENVQLKLRVKPANQA
jgi:hypothetical protein